MELINYKLVGQKIRRKRLNMKLSQEELAEMCKISSSYLGHIERGSRKLSMDVALKLSHKMNLSLDYLFLDAKDDNTVKFLGVEGFLSQCNSEQKARFMNVVNILAENIELL